MGLIREKKKVRESTSDVVVPLPQLDKSIKNIAYILDSLMALRNIYETGSCNDCGVSCDCKIIPKPGQMVRYNCAFYKPLGYKTVAVKDKYICGTTGIECCFCNPCCEHRRHIVK